MSARTFLLVGLAAGLLTLSTLPVAAASSSCSDSANSLQFSLGCGMGGTCSNGSVCILHATCTASFLGVATGDCAGGLMLCALAACEGTSTLVVLSGDSWSASCSVSGISISAESLSCSVA